MERGDKDIEILGVNVEVALSEGNKDRAEGFWYLRNSKNTLHLGEGTEAKCKVGIFFSRSKMSARLGTPMF